VAIGTLRRVGKQTFGGPNSALNRFPAPTHKNGSKAMYIGIGGLILLIIILYIIFR
jgi:hypothetical protein